MILIGHRDGDELDPNILTALMRGPQATNLTRAYFLHEAKQDAEHSWLGFFDAARGLSADFQSSQLRDEFIDQRTEEMAGGLDYSEFIEAKIELASERYEALQLRDEIFSGELSHVKYEVCCTGRSRLVRITDSIFTRANGDVQVVYDVHPDWLKRG